MPSVDLNFFQVKFLCFTIFVIASMTASRASATGASDSGREMEKQYWAFSMDNDAFAPGSTDYDYTAGAALTYSGYPTHRYWRSIDGLLENIDQLAKLIPNKQDSTEIAHSIETGVYGFTPDQIELNEIQENDRPFSSLVYLSTSRTYLMRSGDTWSSSLTLGVLGLDVFKSLQNRAHKMVGSVQAEGWENQISEGGELTMRYQSAYHHYWGSNTSQARFKTSYFGSLGYLTEAGIALSTRRGRIASPDYRFNPELIAYGERVHDAAGHSYNSRESYYWGGFALKLRAYNVFLQGQFRDSNHTLNSDELRPLLAEVWFGYTYSVSRETKLSYFIRAQSSEIRNGNGDRSLLWGGIILSSSI